MNELDSPVDPQALAAALAGGVIGCRVLGLPTVRSTNDLAWDELHRGAPEGTVVIADAQTAGRGRFGRAWYSPPGVGLWMSVALVPKIPVERAPYLVPLGALAVCDGIDALVSQAADLAPIACAIRWPNDVMVEGKKVAGVLVESRDLDPAVRGGRRGYVVGIGVNVNQEARDFPADLAGTAVSLRMRTGRPVSRQSLAQLLLHALDRWYRLFCDGEFGAVAGAWRGRSALVGRRVRVTSAGESFSGRALDLDPCEGIVVQLDTDAPRWFRTEHVEKLEVLEYG